VKNYIQRGETVTVAAPAKVSAGAGVLVGSLFGIAASDAESGADVEIVTVGVFEIAKVSTDAFQPGTPAYWDDTGGVVTVTEGTPTAKPLIGVALAVAANPSATAIIRLNGSFGA
jgi:predicted RecA/RadA family phage recombinase